MNSKKDFPLLSLFEMPFPVWRHACKTGRKNIAKHLPPGQELPELSEEDYRLWYARYLNHIAKNYHEFLEGIMSGFPEPQYPPEVQDMILHYKIKMSINSGDGLGLGPTSALRDGMFPQSSNKMKSVVDDFTMGKDSGNGNAVVIEYGHHQDSNSDPRKRKIDSDFVDHNGKHSRSNELNRRISRDSAPGSSHMPNGTPPAPAHPGYTFKSEDEFKYKVKGLILYYLDKTLLEKDLIDPVTKRAKVPETVLPNPYAAVKPTQASINFEPKSPITFPEKDRDRIRQPPQPRERPERHERFQSSHSNSGSERGSNHLDRDTDSHSHRSEGERMERNRSRRGRDKKSVDDVKAALSPTANSSCKRCRKGEECWDC